MQCRLCLEDRTLCNSHIVSRFLFDQLMKDEPRYVVFSSKNGGWKDMFSSLVQKLLCKDCEDRFSRWEGYAAKFFNGEIQLQGEPIGKHFRLSGVEYAPLKLFLMSLLWRISITKNPWLKGASLGPHEERIRLLLLNSDPSEVWRYGCGIMAITLDQVHMPDLIVPTSTMKLEGGQCHRIIVAGFAFSFWVANHPPRSNMSAIFVREDGSFILSRKEIHEIPYLAEIMATAIAEDPGQKSSRV